MGVVNHYFICILSLYSLFFWDLLVSPNLEKPVLFLWPPPWKLSCISEIELRCTVRLFCFFTFFLFSLPILSTPFLTPRCPLPHFIEDLIISILFLDLNYFSFIFVGFKLENIYTAKHRIHRKHSSGTLSESPQKWKTFPPVTLNPPNSKSSNHTDKTQEAEATTCLKPNQAVSEQLDMENCICRPLMEDTLFSIIQSQRLKDP